MTELIWDPTDPNHQADPYQIYERLRRDAPVWQSPAGYWVLSRYEDVSMALSDRRFTSRDAAGAARVAPPGPDVEPPTGEVATSFFRNWMTFSPSEEDHRRLRRLYMVGFTPERMNEFQPRLEGLVAELIDGVRDETRFDFIERFAAPLPVAAIGDLLGIPADLRTTMHDLARPLARAFHAVPLTQADMTELDNAISAFTAAIVAFLAETRSNPGTSMIAQLAALEQSETTLSEDELIAGIANLFFGGHHTSVHLLGNGMLALLQHPDQAGLLRQKPELAPSATEELLRFDSPAQTPAARFALNDVELHGTTIPAGDKVLLLIGSANRDEDIYPDADRLNIRRENKRPLVFGRGSHLCIGAPMARMEGNAAFPALVRAFPDLRLSDSDLQRSEHSLFRGLQHLHVAQE